MSSSDQFRRFTEQARQQHDQMAAQQRAGWKRMNDDWDRQAAARAGTQGDLGPLTTGDRLSLLVGIVVLVLLVGGSFFMWLQLRGGDGDGDAGSGSNSSVQGGPGTGEGAAVAGSRPPSGPGETEREVEPAVAVDVPDLYKTEVGKADQALADAGLKGIAMYGDGAPRCQRDTSSPVLGQQPAAGEQVPGESTVEMTLGRTDAYGGVRLPDLAGKAVTEAVGWLENNELQVEVPAADMADGAVVGQTVPGGCEYVPLGSTVVLEVA